MPGSLVASHDGLSVHLDARNRRLPIHCPNRDDRLFNLEEVNETEMLFGDARKSIESLVAEVKALN